MPKLSRKKLLNDAKAIMNGWHGRCARGEFPYDGLSAADRAYFEGFVDAYSCLVEDIEEGSYDVRKK